jgi:hypothetical protein
VSQHFRSATMKASDLSRSSARAFTCVVCGACVLLAAAVPKAPLHCDAFMAPNATIDPGAS